MEIKNNIHTIKGIIYIFLLIYSGSQILENLNNIEKLILEVRDNNNIELLDNKIKFDLSNIKTKNDLNNENITFKYHQLVNLINMLIETFLYFNIVFMLLIFLSQNTKSIIEVLKNE